MKPIRLSRHAIEQMQLRGATESEVEATIKTASWQTARRGKMRAQKSFPFNRPSPVNQQVYPFKIVDVVFAVEPDEIVVVTVLVYYGEEGAI